MRYHQTGEWRERDRRRWLVLDDGDTISTIVIEQSDLHDTRSGQLYKGGAYRVRVTNIPGWRTKTFKGEMAHHQARAYASDAATAIGYWQWWPDL